MSTDLSLSVQKKLRAVLIADSTIMTTYGITQVYDIAKPDAVFPYITLSEINVVPQPAKDNQFFDYVVTIHVWIKADSTTLARQVMSRINTLYNDIRLTLDTADTVVPYFLSNTVLQDPDGKTKHGITRFRVSS